MTLAELAVRLGNSGSQWRPEADRIASELADAMRRQYPRAPEGVPENYARGMVAAALRLATATRASGSDTIVSYDGGSGRHA